MKYQLLGIIWNGNTEIKVLEVIAEDGQVIRAELYVNIEKTEV
jgi:hypothetical protein